MSVPNDKPQPQRGRAGDWGRSAKNRLVDSQRAPISEEEGQEAYGSSGQFSREEAAEAARNRGKKHQKLPEGLSPEEASQARLDQFRDDLRAGADRTNTKRIKKPKAEDYGVPKAKGVGQRTGHLVHKTAGGFAGKKGGQALGGAAGKAAGGAIGAVGGPAGAAAGAAVGSTAGRFVGGVAGSQAGKKVGSEAHMRRRAKKAGADQGAKDFLQAEKEHKQYKKKRRKRRRKKTFLVLLLIAIFYPILMIFTMAFATAAPAIAFLQDMQPVIEFMGLKDKEDEVQDFTDALKDSTSEEDREQIARYEDDLKRALDCAVYPPSEREPGVNCIEGLIAAQGEGDDPWSPVPRKAYWLVPVWQKAAERYGVPWQAVAAINGTRSNFGTDVCNTKTVTRKVQIPKTGELVSERRQIHATGGIGFYRMPEGTWDVNNVDAGAGNAQDYAGCNAPEGDFSSAQEQEDPDGPSPDTSGDDNSSDDPESSSEGSSGSNKMKWPTVPKTPINSGFGPRVAPCAVCSDNHAGVDMAVPEGTKVVAVLDGKVKSRGPVGGYGNYLVLSHGGGIETAYAHLSEFKVAQGQRVQQGQLIALSGNTGNSTGPHLHFEVLRNGAQVDPAPFLDGAEVAEAASLGLITDILTINQPKPYFRSDFLSPLETLPAIKKEVGGNGNPHDAVDASFATAKALAKNGAWDNDEWKYDGVPYEQCDVPHPEGSITYPPTPPGASSGSMPELEGLEEYEQLFSVINKKYPSHSLGESGAKLPMNVISFLAEAAGQVIGVKIPGKTMAQVAKGESGFYPGILGCDACAGYGNTTGYGLWQITSGVGNDSLVEPYGGYEQMLNPVKNALVMATMYKNAKESGDPLGPWYGKSHVTGNNLSHEGGIPAMLQGSAGGMAPSETQEGGSGSFEYKGKKAKDPVSQAVRQTSINSSDCYVAVVHKWYELIKEYPPEGAVDGDVRNRIVEIARAELAKDVSETGGDNVPRYKGGEVAVYNINNAWCQAFASRVWYWAGIKKPLEKMGGLAQEDGLALPAHVDALTAWGQANGKYKEDNPLPGDLAIRGSEHVEIVERVSGGQVASTIGGNTGDAVKRNTGDQGWTHFIEPPGADGQGSYEDAAELSIEDAGIAVLELSGSKSALAGNVLSGPAWSTMKAPIAAAVYKKNGGPGSTAAKIRAALQESDNEAALSLWGSLGSDSKAAKKVDAMLREGGDDATSTSSTRGDCPSTQCISTYGQTDWALSDQARWLKGVVKSDAGGFKYIESVMKGVRDSDTTFGFGQIEGAVLWKGGWGENPAGGWARQMGLLRVNGKERIVTVIAKAENTAAAQSKLTKLVKEYAKKPIDEIGGSATSSGGSGPGASSGPGNLPISENLHPLIKKFAKEVAAGSGLSESVVAAWAIQEGGHLQNPARFNFLNIGPGDDYPNFETGVKNTLDLLHARGKYSVDYGVILRSAGKSDRKQIKAIAASPWCPASADGCEDYEPKIWAVYRTRVVG